MPAAVNHTDIKMETSCAKRIELEVFKMFRYCKISGTVIKRRARRNLSPETNLVVQISLIHIIYFSQNKLTNPCSIKIYRYKGRGYRKIIYE